MNSNSNYNYLAPVVIGGLGGSGTRLIAHCLEEFNFFIGHDLNLSKDNLWFTLIFKHLNILKCTDEEFKQFTKIFLTAMITDESFTNSQKDTINSLVSKDRFHTYTFLKDRANSLISNKEKLPSGTRWGWKEPNSHIVLDRLLKNLPNMKYIHVIRNGLDMAHSSNQNQQKLWGKTLLGSNFKLTPYYSLRFWCSVHKRLFKVTQEMNENFLLLNYDNFCLNPLEEIDLLLNFLEIPENHSVKQSIQQLISTPSSIGRYKQFGIDIFDPLDVSYVQSLGFEIK